MKTESKNNSWVTRKLSKHDKIPYDLLLLADETVEAIDKYIFDSDLYIIEQKDLVIAIYVLYPLNNNEMELKDIPVIDAFQGQGIGGFLLQDAGIKAKENMCNTLLIGAPDTGCKQLQLFL